MTTSVRKFLVVVDDSPEFRAALRYAARRAKHTDGRVTLLRVLPKAVFEHWSGVREEIERQEREEAEALLAGFSAKVVEVCGQPPEILILQGETRPCLKQAVADDPDIKVLVLAAGAGRNGPGPLVASIAKEGVGFAGRKLPVTVVPGDLTDEEIDALA
jgi:nucleotide-binding universal stress UspA family protein